ncbi:B3 domain-containing transcription repressor VAL1 [Artemisia annua]|uniref:B3 domain-containing transcription repressor VAL1 n=1 Tax=Artemisia annua TaxID=35608 RepID=A0A2U1QCH1_ARTAN|nr:B3 domain-containing transcription repressor VAL1 [Artemisia annua]
MDGILKTQNSHDYVIAATSKFHEFILQPIHTTCLASANQWIQIERGTRVMCKECSKINSFLVRNFYNLMDPADGIQTEPHYWPTAIYPKYPFYFYPVSLICYILIFLAYTLILTITSLKKALLFERVLTNADKEFDFSYILIPKILAEAYLPKPNKHYAEGFCIVDANDNSWNLSIQLDRELYILEGLEKYTFSNNLKVGDTVTFYRLVPDGQYQISFRKNHLPRNTPLPMITTTHHCYLSPSLIYIAIVAIVPNPSHISVNVLCRPVVATIMFFCYGYKCG